MKRFLSILSAMLIAGSLVVPAFAAEDMKKGDMAKDANMKQHEMKDGSKMKDGDMKGHDMKNMKGDMKGSDKDMKGSDKDMKKGEMK